jgi:hypothetical protein
MVVEKSFAQMLSVLDIYHHNFDKFRVCIRARSLAYFQARIFCFNSKLTRRLKKKVSSNFVPNYFLSLAAFQLIDIYGWFGAAGLERTLGGIFCVKILG